MKFLRKMFAKQSTVDKQSDDEPAELTPSGPTPKEVKGVLILTRLPMSNSHMLLEKIILQQRSKGYSIAWDIISKAFVTEKFDDEAVLHEKIRIAFSKLGGDDLIERTKVFPCQASEHNSGNYCILFDRP